MDDNVIPLFPVGPRLPDQISQSLDPEPLTPPSPVKGSTQSDAHDLSRYGHDHPLGPFLTRYHPDLLAEDPGLSAEERGWVITEEDYYRRLRHRARRNLITVEREAEIVRMYRKGVPTQDIADKLEISTSTVHTSVNRAMKRTLRYAGADAERTKQLFETAGLLERLLERVLPDPTGVDDNGNPIYPPVGMADIKAAEAILKIQSRRAALTGADQPQKVQIEGEVQHNVAVEVVDRVSRYMDVIDRIQDMGYGSGLISAEAKEIADRSAIEVEAVDIRPLDERVADHQHAVLPFSVHREGDGGEDTPDDDDDGDDGADGAA